MSFLWYVVVKRPSPYKWKSFKTPPDVP